MIGARSTTVYWARSSRVSSAPPLLQIVHQFARHLAVVKVLGIVGNALERASQLRLPKLLALLIELPVALKDALRLRESAPGLGRLVHSLLRR